MPIYEYQCDKCGKEFEEWQKFSDPLIESCPKCGGRTRRLISQSTFVLKGTGWYVTDYGRKDGGARGKSHPKPTSTESSASSDASSAPSAASTSSKSSTSTDA